MTLLDIQNQLVAFFTNNGVFSLLENGTSINVSKEFGDQKEGLIRLCLKDLETAGMVKEIPGGSNQWILTAPLGHSGQQIEISHSTSSLVAEEINAFIDAAEVDWAKANALSLHEGNIVMLLGIIATLRGDDKQE